MAQTVSFNVHPLPTEGINYGEERIGGLGEFSMAKNLREVSNYSFYRGGSIPSMEEEVWIFHETKTCILYICLLFSTFGLGFHILICKNKNKGRVSRPYLCQNIHSCIFITSN